MAVESHGFDLIPAVALLGAGGRRRADLQAPRPRLGARLPRRRPRHRPVRPRPLHRPGVDPPGRRARRGDAPLHHRPRDEAVAAVERSAARSSGSAWRRSLSARALLTGVGILAGFSPADGLRRRRWASPSPRRRSSSRSSTSAARPTSRTARRSSRSCSSRISPSCRSSPSSPSSRRSPERCTAGSRLVEIGIAVAAIVGVCRRRPLSCSTRCSASSPRRMRARS